MNIVNYNKLVRDKIPDIISNDPNVEIIKLHKITSKTEIVTALVNKLLEETEEFRAAYSGNNEGMLEELVDIHEVLDEILFQLDYSEDDLWEARRSKAEQKGVFKDKVFLESVQTHN